MHSLQTCYTRAICTQSATERYEVRARGELQLGILIEGLRREGYEFSVSPPAVVFRCAGGCTHCAGASPLCHARVTDAGSSVVVASPTHVPLSIPSVALFRHEEGQRLEPVEEVTVEVSPVTHAVL